MTESCIIFIISGMKNRVVFHIDMDAFFASIEQRDFPQYKGKPVIVGAKPGSRGVVSAASYEARSYGVHSAMPISEAFRRCPRGVFVTPRMDIYIQESRKIMQTLQTFSPYIEQISVDEAFIDMTGTKKLFGTPVNAAKLIKDKIFSETNLTSSIGIAPNKFLAKIGSDIDKPDGITCIPFEKAEIEKWLSPLEVRRIWGVGQKSNAVFERMGIKTIRDLQKLPFEFLHRRFGAQGITLFNLCRGIDNREIENESNVKSISREHTFNFDSSNRDEWKKMLFLLSQDVARRARHKNVKGRTIVLTYRKTDFSRHSRRITLQQSTNIAKLIYEYANSLLCQIKEPSIRLVGVGLTGLDDTTQIDLFEEELSSKDWEISEQTVDKIVSRFGKNIIVKGRQVVSRAKRTDL